MIFVASLARPSFWRARTSVVNWTPFISGIWKSVRITSKANCRSLRRSKACYPLKAFSTLVIPKDSRMPSRAIKFIGSSSTIRNLALAKWRSFDGGWKEPAFTSSCYDSNIPNDITLGLTLIGAAMARGTWLFLDLDNSKRPSFWI
jgi:hypothetical protein